MTEFLEITFFVVVSLMLLILAVIPLLLRKLNKKRLFLPPSEIFTDAAKIHEKTFTRSRTAPLGCLKKEKSIMNNNYTFDITPGDWTYNNSENGQYFAIYSKQTRRFSVNPFPWDHFEPVADRVSLRDAKLLQLAPEMAAMLLEIFDELVELQTDLNPVLAIRFTTLRNTISLLLRTQKDTHTSTTPSRAGDPGTFQAAKVQKSCGTCTFFTDGYCGLHDLYRRPFGGYCSDYEPHTHTRSSQNDHFNS